MQEVGVKLVADGSDQYLNTLSQVAAAETKLASAAAPAVAGINALDDSAGGAARQLDMFADDASLAARDAALLGSKSDAAGDDVLGLGKDADKAAAGVSDLDDASRKGGKGAKQLGDDAEKGSKGLSVLDKIADGATKRIGHLLTDAAAQAGQAILRFVGDTVNAAGDFESGMNRFASVTGDALGDSGQSLEDFKELFISLGRELPVSTADVQQAAIEMAKGGIEPATIAAGGLRDVLNLAAAGEVSIAEAAEIASKQLGVWVDSAADATTKAAFLKDSVNLLSQAANASTVDVDDLALGLANSGKSADLAGLSFRETVTSMALISSGFSSAADAGTSFKTFLDRLQPKTESASAAFKELNLLTADGTSKFYDATGSFVGMETAAELLKGSLEGMSEAQRISALSAAFGSDAIRAAGMLADAGAEGYQHMAEEMAKAGSAAVQAAKKQQGFNVAVDNLLGSLEAFQITVGSAMLPILTKLANLVASGINAITDYADATIKGETALASIASVISDAFIPALVGTTAALTAYAIVQVATATPATIALIAKVALATEAFYAQAAATLIAIAPYAVMAAAIGAVVYAYNNFNETVHTATQELLNSKPWWEASTLAIDDYATQTGEAKKALEPFAATIAELRTEIEADTEALGRHEAEYAQFGAASGHNREQLDAELAAIVAKKDGLIKVTDAYTAQSQAIIDDTAASITATNVTTTLTDKINALGDGASLTQGDIEKLTKAIEDNAQKGQDAVQKYATTYSEFVGGVEQRANEHAEKIAELEAKKQKATTAEQRQGIDDQIAQVNQSYADQEQSAAQSYAAQQAAQKQHLGQMLLDYTVAQAQLAGSDKERKDRLIEVTKALEVEYGLQQSSVASTYLQMTSSIDDFSHEAGGDIHTLIGDMRAQSQQAEDTQKKMDDAFKDRTYEITSNFVQAKGDADDYARALENIPKEINTTVTTTYREKQDNRGDDSSQQSPGRAVGGPVEGGQSYLVGEKGPEYFVPESSGTILTASETRRAMASGAQLAGARGGGATISNQTIINVDARGSALSMGDVTRGVQAALLAEGRNADVLVRTGAW